MCNSVPSSDTSRSPRQNTPGVAGVPCTPATWPNSQRSGAAPSRARALVTEPVRAGRVHFSPARRGMFSSSSRSTPP